jgi:hypothetical protein
MIGDPIFAIKWFALFVATAILIWIELILAKSYRLTFSKIKLFASNAEIILIIMLIVDVVLAVLCLVWSVIAWIVS